MVVERFVFFSKVEKFYNKIKIDNASMSNIYNVKNIIT